MGPSVVMIKGETFGLTVILTGPLEVILEKVPDMADKSRHKILAYITFSIKITCSSIKR